MRLHSCKWLLAAGLVAGGIAVYRWYPELHHWFRRHQFRVEGFDEALPSQVYFLETNRWLEFDIPTGTPLIRLISNANLSSGHQASPGTQWPYAIEYELRSRLDRVVTSGTYHFKAEQLVFLDRRTSEPVEVNFYLKRQYSPLGGRRFILNLKDPSLTNAQVLRLRLHSSHQDLREVAVRVHFQSKVPERKVAYLWNRLSEDQKRDLARGNVYSSEGLSEWEKHGLLRYRWAAAAPEGVPGRDFQRRILHIRDDSERLSMLKDWTPSGIPVDAEHRGVLPITNAPGRYQVQMFDPSPAAPPPVVSSTLSWHGQRQGVESLQFSWSGTNQTVLPANREGFLEVGASHPVYVRTFQVETGQTNETTPEPVPLLAFTVCLTNSLTYAVDHVGESPTFFRVDLRCLTISNGAALSPDGMVGYELLTGNGETVQAGEVALTNPLSAYDWLVTQDGLTNISEPQSLCFLLPPAVQSLRISALREAVLVNAYSRPSELVKRVLVPDDYSPANRLQPDEPVWFTVRPPDHRQRRDAAQGRIVRVQPRPPGRDPRVEAGQYEWESFMPAADARGQMILLPLAEGQPSRPDSLPFCYFPIRVGGEQRVRIQGEAWKPQVAPSLMLVSTNEMPGSVAIQVDGQVLLDSPLEARVTQIRLGNLNVGEHSLDIRSSGPLAAYLNYLESATNAAYLQRFCILASSNVLRFPYLKRQAGAELLLLKVFSPLDTEPLPFEVHLKLKPAAPRGVGPHAELTLLERVARVTPNPVSGTYLVAATPAQVDDGRQILFPVGSDLPPGQHELEVTVVADSPRWLSLSRTTPGLGEKLGLTSERRLD